MDRIVKRGIHEGRVRKDKLMQKLKRCTLCKFSIMYSIHHPSEHPKYNPFYSVDEVLLCKL